MYYHIETDSTVDHVVLLDVGVSFLEVQLSQSTQPEPLPDLVRFHVLGVGAADERPLDPRVRFCPPGVGAADERPYEPCTARTSSGHLGLWEDATLGLLGQNGTAITPCLARLHRPVTDLFESVSAQVTGSPSGTGVRDELRGSPTGVAPWQRSSPIRDQDKSRGLGARRGEVLTTPVTTSVPTQTTTSVLFRSLTSPATTESGAAVGVYTRAGVTWSTAPMTSVFGPFRCDPVGKERRNTEDPSSSSQVRPERLNTLPAITSSSSLYDPCVAVGGVHTLVRHRERFRFRASVVRFIPLE